MRLLVISVFVLTAAASVFAQAPKGKDEKPSDEEAALMAGLKGTVKGTIVWSTSRNGNHDLYLMAADGTNPRPLTKGPKTDWYPRFSPDGKQVLFTRSKLDWTSEEAGNTSERWDTWVINTDGTGEKMIIPKSSWATWRPDGKTLVYARDKDVYTCAYDAAAGTIANETKIVDGDKDLKGGLAQNPNMSDDGELLAVTLRGSQRETGVLNMKKHTWFTSGVGCQINFFPNSHKAFRVDETGIGMTRIFAFDMGPEGVHGKISGGKIDGKSIELMDLPGRRSHEYFPKVSQKGDYLVWCATAHGHDHDIADYEMYLWKIGTPYEKAVRLTFHSGNDRWPDIHLDY